jgi:hypothetical protein
LLSLTFRRLTAVPGLRMDLPNQKYCRYTAIYNG